MTFLKTPEVHRIIDAALSEDLSSGDITSEVLFQNGEQAKGILTAKENMVICGLPLIEMIISKLDSEVNIELYVKDGDFIRSGKIIGTIWGDAVSLLSTERTVLNFIQHLSAIATKVRTLRELSDIQITDTRKTIPGLRYLQKYAVRTGGGVNHRFNTGSGIMIKDNHIDALGSIRECVDRIRKGAPHPLKIEVEVRNFSEARDAIDAGADILLLDNMTNEDMREITSTFKGKAIFEASGGITVDRIPELKETGVDIISIGALTHTVSASDISMTIDLNGSLKNEK
ncbi:MAG: carboxylating nicotinate-nucleotide diphosphorylase [Deltaproteobacteria bacterium]|nr:carboxylating nicotinate-nucleotide diphosphorylase [Deltaproteobacteria bacterium]